MFEIIKYIIYCAITFFIFSCLYLYFNQNKMIYMTVIEHVSTRDIKANPQGNRHPGEANMIYEEVYVKTKDNLKLFGWFIKQALPFECPTLIYFQENAGNIGMRIPFMKRLYQKLKVNILIVGYRGYGYSEGEPTEQGLMLDGEAIMDYVFTEMKEKIDTKNVYILGRSLGGAVGVYCASQLPNYGIKGLILENTFTSIGDLVDLLFSYVKYIRKYLQKNFWPSDERISKIRQPILFILSEKDELIPKEQMDKLFDSAVNSRFKRKYLINGATHNDGWIFGKQEYMDQIKRFLDDCTKDYKEINIEEEKENFIKDKEL